MITASQLYAFLICPHRVTMDAFGDLALRDEPNAFVQLLWESGSLFEKDTIEALSVPFTDLSAIEVGEREAATREAMARGVGLIYGGRLSVEDLLGEPDLLRREGFDASGNPLYVAIDIKSGRGKAAGADGDPEDGKPKKTYGVQLALYTDLLIRMNASAGRYAFIWDVNGREVRYELDAALGPKTPDSIWSIYIAARRAVGEALAREGTTSPAASSECNLCVWRTACHSVLREAKDLTLLFYVGRTKRDKLAREFPTLADLAGANVERYMVGTEKTTFPGIGAKTLRTLHARARLAVADRPAPYLKKAVSFPASETEIFLDLETFPMRDLCYLHGVVIRRNGDNDGESFNGFFADDATPGAECRAFAAAWSFLAAHPDAAIYVYSAYERTTYKKLAEKYPDVCSVAEVEALFAHSRTTDLYYDVVLPDSEWPTMSFSIKPLAKLLGFEWRDKHPSGAASIEWFYRYLKSRDPQLKQRILDYNQDDCRAMRVLLDGIKKLDVRRVG